MRQYAGLTPYVTPYVTITRHAKTGLGARCCKMNVYDEES
jgi:hypothetical protein